ncbi:DUF2933 domain-containing protein [Micromonospora purpureochromogenes]|uniref:DUF2933 domain-containing protein n=1 Tax=Micromonospora purpureochromogenes TaxID=47872 RepID=UPI00332BF4DA
MAILIVGALAVGVPASSLAVGLLVLACPLMMLFMHAGHGGHGGQGGHGTDGPQAPAQDHDGEHSPAGKR